MPRTSNLTLSIVRLFLVKTTFLVPFGFYDTLVFMHVVWKHLNNVFKTRAFVSIIQKQQTITTAPYTPNPMQLFVIARKTLLSPDFLQF